MKSAQSHKRPRMAFISPVFLFPNDAGGKIRTTNILRGMKGGEFEILLLSPASAEQTRRWQAQLDGVCDRFLPWRPANALPRWLRAAQLAGALPVNVAADRTKAGLAAVAHLASEGEVDLMVFDFVHSSVLRPPTMACPTLCFTHNVEAEIFARHAQQSRGWLRRWLWSSQQKKMLRFEESALGKFQKVVAVSDRDARFFADAYRLGNVESIPTGVDLEYFSWQMPAAVDDVHQPTVVFTGSMDWAANIDGVEHFLKRVWPLVLARLPRARFVVVGRNPPQALKALARQGMNTEFTGFVDDVRPYVHAAQAFVIPLLVGGGTRIKAFEAMAMGCPIVSTAIGMEGLDAQPELHYLLRDDPAAMAEALLRLLSEPALRTEVSSKARAFVEARFGHREAAMVFEDICRRTLAA